jgi:hypothetical protein
VALEQAHIQTSHTNRVLVLISAYEKDIHPLRRVSLCSRIRWRKRIS